MLAGTVFSEIVVWAPVFEPEVDQPVIQRLRGHAVSRISFFLEFPVMCFALILFVS